MTSERNWLSNLASTKKENKGGKNQIGIYYLKPPKCFTL